MDASSSSLFALILAPAFTLWGSAVTGLEVLAFALALGMVIANMRVNPVGWPLAMLSSLLYLLLFGQQKLYGEAGLQLLFAVLAGWGWWQWLRGTDADGQPLQVRQLSARGCWQLAGLTGVGWLLLGAALDRFTDSDVPYWDALPTAGSITGQWLLGRKYLQNWPTWVMVNSVSVVLFALKGLWLTVVLYTLFIGLSLLGWRAWQRLLR